MMRCVHKLEDLSEAAEMLLVELDECPRFKDSHAPDVRLLTENSLAAPHGNLGLIKITDMGKRLLKTCFDPVEKVPPVRGQPSASWPFQPVWTSNGASGFQVTYY